MLKDYEIKIEVRMDAIYIYEKVIAGAGGLPVGTGGKTLLMLSGGIDSPVARMMMRISDKSCTSNKC